ncbi:pyocin knob domain-containing protein [Microbacterium arborescens]
MVRFEAAQTVDIAAGAPFALVGTHPTGDVRTFAFGTAVVGGVGVPRRVGPGKKLPLFDAVVTVYAGVRGDKGKDGQAVSVAVRDAALAAEVSAARSRDAAAGSERVASNAAANAAQSADVASGAAQSASESMADAAISRGAAEASATAAEESRSAAGASAFAAGGSAAAAQGSEEQAKTAQSEAEKARDVALAGQFVGASIGTVDLNTITTPGIYRQSMGVETTLARNYPRTDAAGTLEVLSDGPTGGVVQRYIVRGGPDAVAARGFYIRRYQGGVWSPWRFFASQRVDQTAGRAIYTWDDLNGREQLIYGDTGWRDVSALLMNGAGATTFLIRRIGFTVYARISSLQLPSTAVGDTVLTLPIGFGCIETYGLLRESVATGGGFGFALGGGIRLYANVSGGANNTTHRFTGVLQAITDQAWPTALPGTAVGSVPV